MCRGACLWRCGATPLTRTKVKPRMNRLSHNPGSRIGFPIPSSAFTTIRTHPPQNSYPTHCSDVRLPSGGVCVRHHVCECRVWEKLNGGETAFYVFTHIRDLYAHIATHMHIHTRTHTPRHSVVSSALPPVYTVRRPYILRCGHSQLHTRSDVKHAPTL